MYKTAFFFVHLVLLIYTCHFRDGLHNGKVAPTLSWTTKAGRPLCKANVSGKLTYNNGSTACCLKCKFDITLRLHRSALYFCFFLQTHPCLTTTFFHTSSFYYRPLCRLPLLSFLENFFATSYLTTVYTTTRKGD